MGADMCGYFAVVPEDYVKILNAKLDKIDSTLEIVKDKADGKYEASLKLAIKEFGRIVDFDNDYIDLEPEDALAAIKADRELLEEFAMSKGGIPGRDLSSFTQKINGVNVTVLFAGEMSWGDEPDGFGYTILRALHRFGIANDLWDSVPWDGRRKVNPMDVKLIDSLLNAKNGDEAHDIIVNHTYALEELVEKLRGK